MLFIKFIDNLFYLRVTNICVHTFVINKKIISVHIWKNSLFCCNRRYFRYTVIGNFQTAKSSLFLLRLSNPFYFIFIFLLYHNYSISSISSRSSPNNFNADSIGSFAAISTLQRRSKSIGFMELPPLKNLK